MKKAFQMIVWFSKILAGCAIFAISFQVFLESHHLNAGGVSGLSMVFVKLTGVGSVGLVGVLLNLPLFLLGGWKISKKFLIGSIIGTACFSALLDVFAFLPEARVEPLVAALYGGVFCGLGLGMVFSTGASTGGTDIVVRLMKLKMQHIPIGMITIVFDLCVVALTGIAFQDVSSALYSGVAVFVTGKVIDAVVYRFDYSKVVLIISNAYEDVAQAIARELDRGATYLQAQGSYTGRETRVVLTAVKKQQVTELKRIVTEIDPNAFIIVQEAHQVLGDGFSRYSRDSL